MRNVTQSILAVFLAAGVMVSVGCGDDGNNDDGGTPPRDMGGDTGGGDMPMGAPTIAITSPMANATATGPMIMVDWMTTNWMGVFPPDATKCADASNNCGHVHLRVAPKAGATADADFAVCNDVANMKPYNNAGPKPLAADLGKCTQMSPDGKYTLEVELRHNNHTPLATPAKSSVTITVGGSMGGPTINITSPAANAMVTGPMIMVDWATTNWMGVFPPDATMMTCMDSSNACGHVHLRVAPKANATADADFAVCNDVANMKPYNNAGPKPLAADISKCTMPSADGNYTLEVELRHNNHTPLSPPQKSAVTVKVN